MKKILFRVKKETEGVLSVEAAIALSVFLFFMMFLYSIMLLITGRETINTALVRSAESLALDSYAVETIGSTGGSVEGALTTLLGITNMDTTDFSSGEKWYGGDAADTVQKRFYGYLGGGAAKAKKMLKSVGVSDLSFEGTAVSGGDLVIQVKYKIEPSFNLFDLVKEDVTRTLRVKMWGVS